MKTYIIFIIDLIILGKVSLEITKKKRDELLEKNIRKISSDDFDFESYFLGNINLKYDINKINNIIKDNGFPEEYNFFKDTGKTPNIKNQGNCGCCWAMASTTALSYRYYKIGIDVDFTPQEALSCYINDCEYGNSNQDSQLNLVKNGTITEECLPFSSGNQSIEECPTSCKDGTDFKRYYAKNVYISKKPNDNNFYEIVTLIMDQLINFGPVMNEITCYLDFQNFFFNESCPDEVYTYDGVSEDLGGHSMVIVGYGFLKNKYYWLVQNSWGKGCDGGLVKIEFGQVGVESISFSEPYIEKEELSKEIDLKLNYVDSNCILEVSTNSSLDDWKSPLFIRFEDLTGKNYFNYICGVNTLINESKIINCYLETQKLKISNGKYKFKDFESLGKENTFFLDNSSKETSFDVYGSNFIENNYDYPLYVSEKGSRITFSYIIKGLDDSIPKLYINEKKLTLLKNCREFSFFNNVQKKINNIIYCDLEEDEFNYFKINYKDKIIYNQYCGLYYSNVLIEKLDTNKYPVFKIRHFSVKINPSNLNIINALIIADIEGSLSEFKESTTYFGMLVNAEIENINRTAQMQCFFKSPSKLDKNFIISCMIVNINNYDKASKYYLLPFYNIINTLSPFEIMIKNTIQSIDYIPAQDKDKSESSDSSNKDIIFIMIISILGLIIIILIFLIIKINRRGKKNDINEASGPLLNNDITELKSQ